MPRTTRQLSKAARSSRRILVLDVGGTHVKYSTGKHGLRGKFRSGLELSANEMVRKVRHRVPDAAYDVVSIGYPGLVLEGRIIAEPYNLGEGWVGFDFEQALGKPTRLANDAAMQALGSYHGGRMLFLGLGTGLGATLIIEGAIQPLELGHLPFKHHRSFEHYTSERARLRQGNRKWRREVREVIARLGTVFRVDYIVIGGGNAKRLERLPRAIVRGDNRNAMRGGELLWSRERVSSLR